MHSLNANMNDLQTLVLGFAILIGQPLLSQAAAALKISTVGNTLAFDQKTLQAHPGEQVTLTFHNSADEGSGMQHTWVLVKPGAAEQVASEAVSAGRDRGYIPNDPNIIAHTGLVQPGQSETIHFPAPAQPGDYPYICTFPSHSRLLKGVLEVRG